MMIIIMIALDGGGKKEIFFSSFENGITYTDCNVQGYLYIYICKGEKYREKAAKGEKTRRED